MLKSKKLCYSLRSYVLVKEKAEDVDWFAYRCDKMVGPTIIFSTDLKWLSLVSLDIQGVEPHSSHPRCQLIVMMISRTASHLPG